MTSPVADLRSTRGARAAGRGARAGSVLAASIALTLGGAVAMPAAAPAATLSEKQAEATKIADQVAHLDTQLDALNERHRDASLKLDALGTTLQRLNGDLEAQQRALAISLDRLQQRAVTVYEGGDEGQVLLKLIGSGSITEVMDRADAISRVSQQDADIVTDIRTLRAKVSKQQKQVARATGDQRKLVVRARKDASAIATREHARAAVLASVNGEIRSMVAAEQAAAAARAAAASRAAAARLGAGGGGEIASNGGVTASTTTATAGGASATTIQPNAAAAEPAPPAPAGTTDVGAALSNPAPPPPSSGHGGSAAGIAMGQIGVQYVYGGSTPSGFDCSGLVMWAYAQAGVSLPHSSYAQWNVGTHVTRDQLQVGDLIFSEGLGHVGIYVGGGSYIHAPHTGDVVKISPLPSGYVGAVRVA